MCLDLRPRPSPGTKRPHDALCLAQAGGRSALARAGHRPCDARCLTGALRRALAALCHHRRRRRRQQRRRQAMQKVAGGQGQFRAVLTSLPKGPCQSLSTGSFPASPPAVPAPDHRQATRATQDGLQRVDSDCPGPAHRAGIRHQVAGVQHRQAPRTLGFRPQKPTQRAMKKPRSKVFSKPGMSLERPEIDDAKRVDPL